MSLIQQALEKTNRAHETRTTTPVAAPKTWEQDPMGGSLEQELVQVQKAYARRRNLYWKVTLGVLGAFFVAGLFYAGFHGKNLQGKPMAEKKASAVPIQVPVRIYSGNIYRLTGITDLSGNPIAVINNRLVGVGDVLGGGTVVKAIGNGSVLLEVRGKEIKLVL